MIWVDILRSQCFCVAGSASYETYLCKSKVKNLGMITFNNENVRWLDVSMDDALRVGGIQSLGHANRHLQQRFQFHGATSDGVFQGPAFQELHRDEAPTILFANLVDSA